MAGGAWRGAVLGLVLAGLAVGWIGIELARLLVDDPDSYMLDMGAVALAAVALGFAFTRLSRHFRDLDRLEADIGGARGRQDPLRAWAEERRDELGRLAAALADALRSERRAADRIDGSLPAVLAMVREPMLVLTETGRIQVLNAAAARLLGEAARPGADVYNLVNRPELFRAIEQARGAGHAVAATLHRRDGADLPARVADLGLFIGAVVQFQVEAVLPALPAPAKGGGEPVDAGMTLAAAPIAALWVETDAASRVTAVGTVRLSGARVFRTMSLEFLIDPDGQGGAGGRPFAAVWPALVEALRGCLVVGYEVGVALDALRAEAARAGYPAVEAWPALDLRGVAAGLAPELAVPADLGGLAAALGVATDPRRDRYAPERDTAAVASAVLGRLIERGIDTVAAAQALARPVMPAAAQPEPAPPKV